MAANRPKPSDSAKPPSCPACGWSPGAPLPPRDVLAKWPDLISLAEISREFERLHQLLRELDALLDESQTLRRHVSVTMAKLALCLREVEDEAQDDRL